MMIFEDYGIRIWWESNGWKIYFGSIKITNDIKMPQIMNIIIRRIRVNYREGRV